MIPIDTITLGMSYRYAEGGRYTVTGFPNVTIEGEECPGVSYTPDEGGDEQTCSKVQFSERFTWEPV